MTEKAGDEPEGKRRRVDDGGDATRGEAEVKSGGAPALGCGFDPGNPETFWGATGAVDMVLYTCPTKKEQRAMKEARGLLEKHVGAMDGQGGSSGEGRTIPLGPCGLGHGLIAFTPSTKSEEREETKAKGEAKGEVKGGAKGEGEGDGVSSSTLPVGGEDVLGLSSSVAGRVVSRIYGLAEEGKVRSWQVEKLMPVRCVCDGSDPDVVEAAVLEAVARELRVSRDDAAGGTAGGGEGKTVRFAISAKLGSVGKRRGTEGATTLKDRVIRGAARAVERAAELHNEAGGKGGRGKVTFKVDLSSPDVVVMLHGVQGEGIKARLLVGWAPARYVRLKKNCMRSLGNKGA